MVLEIQCQPTDQVYRAIEILRSLEVLHWRIEECRGNDISDFSKLHFYKKIAFGGISHHFALEWMPYNFLEKTPFKQLYICRVAESTKAQTLEALDISNCSSRVVIPD